MDIEKILEKGFEDVVRMLIFEMEMLQDRMDNMSKDIDSMKLVYKQMMPNIEERLSILNKKINTVNEMVKVNVDNIDKYVRVKGKALSVVYLLL